MISKALPRSARRLVYALYMSSSAAVVLAQETPVADPGSLAFEQGRWEDVIVEYRAILAASPDDRMSLLRIAQAERELGRHEAALATLEQARLASAPEAMVDMERARNLLALGRRAEALEALEVADHIGLRALELLEESPEFDAVRDDPRFARVHASVRARVFPCASSAAAREFDFWLGRWEVRMPDGTLAGYNNITQRDGGCTIQEQWEGSAGSSGTSLSFYLPSREQWRQVWVGSGATLIDMTGGLVDGEMRMEGTIEYADQDRVVAFRASWAVAPDGRVRQRMEEFDLASQSWSLWFDGLYRRVY
jgi:tetratricopeptide (TPR) repeat protein